MKKMNGIKAMLTTVPYYLLLLSQLNHIEHASSFIIADNNLKPQSLLNPKESTTTAIFSFGGRGLETSPFGGSITPEEGGMTLYLKAGEDGNSIGDCPFAQYVRIVLEEKELPYDIKPCVEETKPSWLINYYEGKMPALRHRSECYIDSEVISQYVNFFFPSDSPLITINDDDAEYKIEAKEIVSSFFPALAKYLKHAEDDDTNSELESDLISVLSNVNQYLKTNKEDKGFQYLLGNDLSLLDCSLSPKLFHMDVAVQEYKGKDLLLENSFMNLMEYKNSLFQRNSFINTCCRKEDIIWGWGNARN